MQTITAQELQLLQAYTPVTLHLYVGGAEIPAKMGSYSQTNAVGGDELSCGAAIAGSIQLGVDAEPIYRILTTRAGEIITDRAGKAFAARLLWRGVYGQEIAITWDVDGETENPLFTGRVEKVTVSAGKATIRAQDALFWSGAEIFRGREDYQADADAGTVFAAIAGEMGVAVDADTASLLSGVTISGGFSSVQDDITLAEAAGYVAGIFGGNAVITRAGTLAVIRYTLRDYSAEVYAGGAEAENQNYKLAGLRFSRTYTTRTVNADGTTSLSDRIVTYKAGNGSLELDNPLASQAAATRAYRALSAVTVRKGRYSYPLGLIVEPGDVIGIVTMDGTYRAAVSSHTLEIDGGVKSSDLGAGALDPDGTSGAAAEEEPTRLRARMTKSLLAAAAEESSEEDTGEAPTKPGRKPRISKKLEELELKLLRVVNLYAENAEIVSAKIQNLFAEEILCTNSFEVNNSVWELLQDSTGFKLQTKAKSTVYPYNPIARLSMDATGGAFTFGDFGSGLRYVAAPQGSSLYEGGTLTLLNGATGIRIDGDVIDIGGGSKVAIGSLSIGNAIIPDDFSTPSIGTSSSRFDYIYLSHNPNVSSDRNVKREIREDLPDIVDLLRPVRYKRRGGPETVHYGFIAQEVEAALEAAGADTADLGILTFDTGPEGNRKNFALAYGEFVPLLVDKIQRQQKQIDELTRRIEALERRENNG